MKEKVLDRIIRRYGFEHPYTIKCATMIEAGFSLEKIEDYERKIKASELMKVAIKKNLIKINQNH